MSEVELCATLFGIQRRAGNTTGYLHIDNLYKNQEVLNHNPLVVMEKVHGTSAHVRWNGPGQPLVYFHGGASRPAFLELFNDVQLAERFALSGHAWPLTVYGEAFGGSKLHKMQDVYGPNLRFVAFDVKLGDDWLNVYDAHSLCLHLGIDFVPYRIIVDSTPTKAIQVLDEERAKPSHVAEQVGIEGAWREGVVVKPLREATDFRGNRIIAKHKRPEARETKAVHEVGEQLAVLANARQVAEEFVTRERLNHVLDHLAADGQPAVELSDIPRVMAAMTEDILREGREEFQVSRDVTKAVGRATVLLFKQHLEAAH